MRKTLLLFSVLAFTSVHAQDFTADSLFIKRISNNILSSNDAYENLSYLTKKIGNRLAGSPGMVKSERWGLETLRRYKADSAYLQQCMVPHWVRGGKDFASVSYIQNGKRVTWPLNVLALGNSMGSGKKGITAPVLVVKSFDDLEARKDQVKGKIVFFDIPFGDTLINPFESYRAYAGYRGAAPSRSAKYGAVGILLRSMSHSTDNLPHTGATRYNDSFPKIPAVAVGLRDVAKMSRLASNGVALSAVIRTNGMMLPDTIGHNVIAEIRGTDYPDEYITIGGHLDSWDVGEGAHDDGAGVVQTIEVLRAFRALGYQPRHTIRFVLFANEENGLRGGQKYAEAAKAANEKHIFALESDAGGFTPRSIGMSVPDAAWPKVAGWQRLLSYYGIQRIDREGGGADIGPLARLLKTPLGGYEPDSQRYFDHHHADSDRLEAVNIRELKLGAINMAALVYLVDQYGL
ncbi:MAG TPA: M20/M25/M40 family metallo-hydrolase [Chitinophagaceae bacterium]